LSREQESGRTVGFFVCVTAITQFDSEIRVSRTDRERAATLAWFRGAARPRISNKKIRMQA
jgi:hypothetical protein